MLTKQLKKLILSMESKKTISMSDDIGNNITLSQQSLSLPIEEIERAYDILPALNDEVLRQA
jgi:hypothetical protein